MQAAKQIRLSRNARRSSRGAQLAQLVKTESIHLKQNSALRAIEGMFSTAANACARSFSSGT